MMARDLIIERMRDIAAEKGTPFEPERADNLHRLNMAMFPEGAEIIPNPYNKIAGFFVRTPGNSPEATGAAVYFVPGFPVMAWPMIEWVLDEHCAHLHRAQRPLEQSVIVMGAMEASLTPLMELVEAHHPGVKVFSLPSVDHPEWGAHIELGVKGPAPAVVPAYALLMQGLRDKAVRLGPELVR